jgi:hypothetical protein
MTALLDGLALIARYGTQLFIASILIGLALPLAAATARPLLGSASSCSSRSPSPAPISA